jgi:S-adenosylmethionine:tRNA ribosyltransferase-isomerase
MKVSDFRYDLPDELIARHPPVERGGGRLLRLEGASGRVAHHHFGDLPGLLRAGDLLVFNDTRVIPARLFGFKTATGGGVELLIERVLDEQHALAHIRASKAPRPGSTISLVDADGLEAARVAVLARHGDLFELEFPQDAPPLAVMQAIGHVPLPPYIDRADTGVDRERYQTVYARREGAVAAPTAGLHFDLEMMDRLRKMGVETAFVTLHVGAGTFQPVRVESVEEHRMHTEMVEVGAEVCERVAAAHAEKRRVIAVGTTTLRCLESASDEAGIAPCNGETALFIYPGYRFRCVDALITNFHLPESTLLMLVCAFAGTAAVLDAYRAAVAARYRFFSYGDAMLVEGAQVPLLKSVYRHDDS